MKRIVGLIVIAGCLFAVSGCGKGRTVHKAVKPQPETESKIDMKKAFPWKMDSAIYPFTHLRMKGDRAEVVIDKGEVCFVVISNGQIAGGYFKAAAESKESYISVGKARFPIRHLYGRWYFEKGIAMLTNFVSIETNGGRKVGEKDAEFTNGTMDDLRFGGHINELIYIDGDRQIYVRTEMGICYTQFERDDFTGNPDSLFIANFYEHGAIELYRTIFLSNGFRTIEDSKDFNVVFSPQIEDDFILDKLKKMSENKKRVTEIVGLTNIASIKIFFFQDNGEAKKYLYRDLGFALPEMNTIFMRRDQSWGHEVNHMLGFYRFGYVQNGVLDEGFATYFNGNQSDFDAIARAAMKENPALEKQLTDGSYFRIDDCTTLNYELCASIVGFILKNYGVETFGKLWSTGDFKTAMEKSYGAFIAEYLAQIKK